MSGTTVFADGLWVPDDVVFFLFFFRLLLSSVVCSLVMLFADDR